MTKKVCLGILFLIIAQQYSVYGQILGQSFESDYIVTAVPFLNITPDSRSAAMGDVGVATSPDNFSAHWNASKLAFSSQKLGFGVSYTPWLEKLVGSMSLKGVSGFVKITEKDVIGTSIRYFNLGSILDSGLGGFITGDFKSKEHAIDVSYARKISSKLSAGFTIKYFDTNIAGKFFPLNPSGYFPGKIRSFAFDLSMYYSKDDLEIFDKKSTVSWGINISNIGPKIVYRDSENKDFIPANLRIGAALTTDLNDKHKFCIAMDLNKLLVPTTDRNNPSKDSAVSGIFKSFTDAPRGLSEELKEINIGIGIEYYFNNTLALRTGYFNEPKEKGNRKYFSTGMGIKSSKVGLDLAYLFSSTNNHWLDDTLRFSLNFTVPEFAGKS